MKRYGFTYTSEKFCPVAIPNGEWVKYSDVADLQTQLTAVNERAERAEADCASMIEEFNSIMHIMDNSEGIAGWHLNGDICPWGTGLYQEVKDILDNPHPGAELLERVKVLEAERDAVVNDTRGYCASCAFVDDCAKHDNNDAAPSVWYYGDCDDWQWHFIAQAKEGRP